MAPDIRTSDERALRILDAAEVKYEILPKSPTPQPITTQPISYTPNPQDYILIPGIKSGKEKRPDLLVCKYRLGLDAEVEQAGTQLGLNLQNTAQEQNQRKCKFFSKSPL